MNNRPAWLDTIDNQGREITRLRDALLDIEDLATSVVYDPKSTLGQIIESIRRIAATEAH